MRILFLGDVVGRNARKTVLSNLAHLKSKYHIDFTIVNVENAADGRGVTPKIADDFFHFAGRGAVFRFFCFVLQVCRRKRGQTKTLL